MLCSSVTHNRLGCIRVVGHKQVMLQSHSKLCGVGYGFVQYQWAIADLVVVIQQVMLAKRKLWLGGGE